MRDNVHANLAAIHNMETACDRFAHVVKDSLPTIQRELERVNQALDDRRVELQREISSLQDEISSADEEDDTSWASSRIEESEEDLASVRRRIQRLSVAGAAVTGQTRKIEGLASDHAIRTKEFLRGTADDLKAYFAKTIEGTSGNRSAPLASISAATMTPAKIPEADAEKCFDPTCFVLPAGFVWVPLNQIDRSLDRGGFENADRFTKDATREEMIRGFNALKNEILPAMANHNSAADSYFFSRIDQNAGSSHESGVQRPFDAFFGSDHIYLERRSDTEMLNVTNGRHRILVASQLGWTAVPAKVSTYSK
jgi:hypothetical protein